MTMLTCGELLPPSGSPRLSSQYSSTATISSALADVPKHMAISAAKSDSVRTSDGLLTAAFERTIEERMAGTPRREKVVRSCSKTRFDKAFRQVGRFFVQLVGRVSADGQPLQP